MSSIVLVTMGFALLSVFARAGLNIIDRSAFGHAKAPLLKTSMINNIIVLAYFAPIIIFFGDFTTLLYYFSDYKLLIFASLMQCVAYIFAIAFRHASVSSVLLASKIPDVFIPVVIFILLGYWKHTDALFSIATVFMLYPVWRGTKKPSRGFSLILLLMVIILIIQAGAAPLLMSADDRETISWLDCAFVLVVFRLLISVLIFFSANFFDMTYRKEKKKGLNGLPSRSGMRAFFFMNSNYKWLSTLCVRGIFAVSTQLFFVAAISLSEPVVAWPILNSTTLFAIWGASTFLGEKPSRAEWLAVFGITGCLLTRTICEMV